MAIGRMEGIGIIIYCIHSTPTERGVPRNEAPPERAICNDMDTIIRGNGAVVLVVVHSIRMLTDRPMDDGIPDSEGRGGGALS